MKWILITLLLSPVLGAQISEEEHLSHHPEQRGEQPTSKPADSGGMGGMMGDMGGMMEKMGVPPPKDTYPTLMDMPNLPAEKRAEFESQAHERMKLGARAMTDAIAQLTSVASGSDFAAMQDATTLLREGLAQFESGLAAHRALREGQPPQNVSLHWFKKEMSLTEPTHGVSTSGGVLGLGWFHLISMIVLAAFALIMIWMYYHKMQRASALIAELSERARDLAPSPEPESESAESTPQSTPPSPSNPTTAPPPLSVGKWSGELEVALVTRETPEVNTLRLVEANGHSIPFTFRPGQFATLTVEAGGKEHKRCYTIASSPTQRDYVELTVKGEPEGVVSKHLCSNVQPGQKLRVAAPAGVFTFDGNESESIVLIGGGVGITPLMTVIRYLTDRAWPGEIVLIYSCRTSSLFIFREELEFLQHRHANLKVVATMTRDPGTDWMGLQGHITQGMISNSVPDITKRRIHVCGPSPMMDAVNSMLADLGVPPNNIKTEAFGPAARPKPKRERSTAPPETGFEVSFSQSQKTGQANNGQTILDVAERLDIEIENSCRVGTCGSCRVKLASGSVHMPCDDGLDPDDKADGFVLACQAEPDSDLVVEE